MRVQALEQPSQVMPTLNSVTLVILASVCNLESERLSRVSGNARSHEGDSNTRNC